LAMTSVWSLTDSGPMPTVWWKRDPTSGQRGSNHRT
jgi:hypothetical protein